MRQLLLTVRGYPHLREVFLCVERNWNMRIPGFGTEEGQPPAKKPTLPETHKQRLALIKQATSGAAAATAATKKA